MPSADPILGVIQDAARLLTDGVVVTTADLDQPGPRILHVNDACCRITGYRADELIGKTPRLLQGAKTNRAVLAAMRSALEVHRQFSGEIVNYRKDGRDYTVQLQVVPLGDADGQSRYWLSLHRDVSEGRRTEAELRDREYRFRSLLSNMRDIIVCHGVSGTGPHGYEGGAMLLGRDVQRMAGTRQGEKANIELWYRSIHPDDRDAYLAVERRRKELGEAYTLEYRVIHPLTRELRWMRESGWTVQQLDGDLRFYDSYIIDVTERKRVEELLAGQNRILEMVARGRPLADTLDSLARFIESQSDGMLCSILLLDEEGRHLRHGAAPSLPEAYSRAIHGLGIGPKAGSCGTAAHRREPVIVTDTYEDPLWADYRNLAMAYELRSCWSTPIFSEEGRVLGTFAMYYRNVRSPSPAEQKLIDIATHVAGIAIARERAQAAQGESGRRPHRARARSASATWRTRSRRWSGCATPAASASTSTGRGSPTPAARCCRRSAAASSTASTPTTARAFSPTNGGPSSSAPSWRQSTGCGAPTATSAGSWSRPRRASPTMATASISAISASSSTSPSVGTSRRGCGRCSAWKPSVS